MTEGGGIPLPTPLPASVTQTVRAESGHAYGVIGADIHVFGDGTPVYLLFEHTRVPEPDPAWQRAQPSRMLDARAEAVPFTGRDAELRELIAWRDAEPGFQVRWLHGEGGQGKTRLANELAIASAGWKVVDAAHRTDARPPASGSQDLRLDGHAGVLLLVDYADRWPLSDLSWLLQNRLLRQNVPTRVLLIARSADGWPAVQGKLAKLRENIDTSDQYLPPLPDDGDARARLFAAARDSFARRYPEIAEPESVAAPGPLLGADFELTLAVLMAALVTVDAAAGGRRVPSGIAGMTVYLLNREHENWQQLFENQLAGLDYRTPAPAMARLVFTAALTGRMTRPAARSALRDTGFEAPGGTTLDFLLDDHAKVYRPLESEHDVVLEPMLPDRLAEDFLALTLPGSPISGHPTDEWATGAVAALLTRRDGVQPAWIARAVTFLAAAADRWRHVGDRHLYPVVNADPQLALDAGSAALSTLAGVGTTDVLDDGLLEVLSAVRTVMPHQHFDLELGMLAVSERVTAHHLATGADTERQAGLHSELTVRRLLAGDEQGALAAATEAADLFRSLAAADDTPARRADLGAALRNLGSCLASLEQRQESLAPMTEATRIFRELVETDPTVSHLAALATSLGNLGSSLDLVGRVEEAVEATAEASELLSQLVSADVGDDSTEHLAQLSGSYTSLGNQLAKLGRSEEALSFTNTAVGLSRMLAGWEPATQLPMFAMDLMNLSRRLSSARRFDESLAALDEAVEIRRRLAEANPGAHLRDLAIALLERGNILSALGREDDALTDGEQALALFRDLGDRLGESAVLIRLAAAWGGAGRLEEAIAAGERAAAVFGEFGETVREAQTRLTLGHNFARSGMREQCATAYQRAAALFLDAGIPDRAGEALLNCGRAFLELSRFDEATAVSGQAAELFTELFDRHGDPSDADAESMARYNLGHAYRKQRRIGESIAEFRRATAQCRRIGNLVGASMMCLAAADTCREAERYDEYIDLLSEAADLCRETGDRDHEGQALGDLARVLLALGRFEDAADASRRAAAVFASAGNTFAESRAFEILRAALAGQS